MTGDNGIGEPIDRKFIITAKCSEHEHSYDDNHGVFFCAKDLAFPAALRAYRAEAERIGAGPGQLGGIDRLIERVARYQVVNAGICKVPDVDEAHVARIAGPNV